MSFEQRLLIDPSGAILGRGQKIGAREGLHRANNETRQVFELWARYRTEFRLPRLDEVFPGGLGELLPSILVVDVVPLPGDGNPAGQRDYRYRIAGAREVESRTDDPTGRSVREIYSGENLKFCLENYGLAVASAWGIIDFSVEASANPRFLELETLLLPLSEDGRTVTQVMVYSHYVER